MTLPTDDDVDDLATRLVEAARGGGYVVVSAKLLREAADTLEAGELLLEAIEAAERRPE